jgi:hypothetical protein
MHIQNVSSWEATSLMHVSNSFLLQMTEHPGLQTQHLGKSSFVIFLKHKLHFYAKKEFQKSTLSCMLILQKLNMLANNVGLYH